MARMQSSWQHAANMSFAETPTSRAAKRSTMGSSVLTSISRRPIKAAEAVVAATELAHHVESALASSALLDIAPSPEKQKSKQSQPKQHTHHHHRRSRPYHLAPRPQEALTRVSEKPSLLSQDSPSHQRPSIPFDLFAAAAAAAEGASAPAPAPPSLSDSPFKDASGARQVWTVDTANEEKWGDFAPRQQGVPHLLPPTDTAAARNHVQECLGDEGHRQESIDSGQGLRKGKGKEKERTSADMQSSPSSHAQAEASPSMSPNPSPSPRPAAAAVAPGTAPRWMTAGTRHLHTMSDAQAHILFGDLFFGTAPPFLREVVAASPPLIHQLGASESGSGGRDEQEGGDEQEGDDTAPSPPLSPSSQAQVQLSSTPSNAFRREGSPLHLSSASEGARRKSIDWSQLIELAALVDVVKPAARSNSDWAPEPPAQGNASGGHSLRPPIITVGLGPLNDMWPESAEATRSLPDELASSPRTPTISATPPSPRPPTALSGRPGSHETSQEEGSPLRTIERALAQLSEQVMAQGDQTHALETRVRLLEETVFVAER
ncbi:hypothetical protein FA10DRAFT_270158 [Acaromyces ingoldii]|uniref:Uncharacterized protein n=1 Tax=Acaromyces ingoldii TaxID=215250 RepID=A0A316YAB2_9BASI|nr:hypothetical protein FA10DRAFT_270158 [Acaromyces ingoldii]PWN86606.1 hypothetical protein FA10DRAFT_270158 [Acaromyces ingoldii]